MRDLYTGIFYVNAPTIGAEVHLPFGGTKNTGNGHREAGIAALDVFSEWKSIYIDFSGKLQRAQIDRRESRVLRGSPGSPGSDAGSTGFSGFCVERPQNGDLADPQNLAEPGRTLQSLRTGRTL